MNQIEIIFTVLTVVLYILSAALTLWGWMKKKDSGWLKTYYIFILAVLVHTATLALRTFFSGHLPIFGMYEAALADSWALGVFAWVLMTFQRKLLFITIPTVFIIMILFLQGLGYNINYIPLTISEQSLWVDVHAILAWLTFGFYGLAFAVALILLSPSRWALCERWGLLPESLEDAALRVYFWGFLAQTAMIAFGSFYEYLLFGTWWKWDPVEILSLISWAATGLIIHMRLFYGWSRRRFLVLMVLSFLVLIISYKFLIYFPGWSTYHIFDIDVKVH